MIDEFLADRDGGSDNGTVVVVVTPVVDDDQDEIDITISNGEVGEVTIPKDDDGKDKNGKDEQTDGTETY